MTLFINPGSGPVTGATYENAAANMQAFVEDVQRDGLVVSEVVEPDPPTEDGGRWTFHAVIAGVSREIEMPGLPLAEVRYVGNEDQNIWDFPRLYIDGSSWVWEFAIGVVLAADEDES